ncbi:MAG: hypothetical protein KDC79_00015 [Cyclobacteriaceae bacterium]|nr:hypothetical protein [Cyclobacteriaceae bacterium]
MDKVIAILFGVVGLVMAIYYAIEFQKGKKDSFNSIMWFVSFELINAITGIGIFIGCILYLIFET